MTEFADTVSDYQQAYKDFMLAIQNIKASDRFKGGVCGTWSPKQVIDHLVAWNKEALSDFRKIRAGESINLDYDDDVFNARAVAERSQLTWEMTLFDIEDARTKLIDFVIRLTAYDLANSKVYGDWVKGITDDFQLHREQIQLWVTEE